MRAIELQMYRIDMYFEEKAGIDVIQIFWLFVRNLSWLQVAECEKAVHHCIEVLHLNTVLVDSGLLVMP